jgi:peptidoglycan/xylan/chitin deacetylase (PgdA/CDA1 family)
MIAAMDEAILERRRQRRIIERRRRAAKRRRNFLLGAAGLSFVLGILIGAGHAEPTDAERAVESAATAPPIPESVSTVTGFREPVPVLMYHAIQPAPAGAALPGLFVPEGEFEAEMMWLSDHGYHGVTLAQVFAAWNADAPIAEKPVVVSFDDGLQSQYVGARPMLQKLGWPGVLNLAISHLDSGDMTEEQVGELIDEGWELDSHTFTHLDLTEEGVDLGHEIADSRAYLQDKFGVPVDFFCYPAGRYDDEVVAAVQDAGYLGATTTIEGLASPDQSPYELKRIRVEPGDGAEGLAAKIGAA